MISVRELLSHLDCNVEKLAGLSELDSLVSNLYLLNEGKIWLEQKRPEFKDAIVFVQSKTIPGYSLTFDLLLRYLKQTGAAGVLFQGGKKSDFSKATLILADKLGLPLAWIPESISYSFVTKRFYELYLEAERLTKRVLSQTRRRLERAFRDTFTLCGWMKKVEGELSVTTTIAFAKPEDKVPVWRETEKNEQVFTIPFCVLGRCYKVELYRNDLCPLWQPDSEKIWIDELAGVLSSQTAHFMLVDTPGLRSEHQWATSFESCLFNQVSRLLLMKDRKTGDSVETSKRPVENNSPSELQLSFIRTEAMSSISILWISAAENLAGLTGLADLQTVNRPHAYGMYHPVMLWLREQVVTLLEHAHFLRENHADLLSCIPWRDWHGHEGILVFWCTPKNAQSTSSADIRDMIYQLQEVAQFDLSAYFYDQAEEQINDSKKLLEHGAKMIEDTYSVFLRVLKQKHTIQLADKNGQVQELFATRSNEDSSYHRATQMLQPLLEDKNHKALLEALETYLEYGAKMQIAADHLYLHRNTLRYRLNRVEKLLHINLDDAKERFNYHLAVRTWRLNHPSG